MILPSQARDKHEENSKKKGVSLGLNLAIDGRVVSLVKNSQATRQSWLAANCHTCDCPGRSLCTCESGKALQVISVGREDTANVNERAVLVETITAHIQAERENRCMKARLRFRVVRPPSLKEKATWQQTSPMGSSSRGGSTGQRATPLPSGEQQQQQQKEEKEENDHDKEKVTPRTAAARVAELEAENAALRMDRRLLLQEVETLSWEIETSSWEIESMQLGAAIATVGMTKLEVAAIKCLHKQSESVCRYVLKLQTQ